MHFHAGNHDMWTFGYLEDELGVTFHREPIVRSYDGTTASLGMAMVWALEIQGIEG